MQRNQQQLRIRLEDRHRALGQQVAVLHQISHPVENATVLATMIDLMPESLALTELGISSPAQLDESVDAEIQIVAFNASDASG